jgi:hypothetical protein
MTTTTTMKHFAILCLTHKQLIFWGVVDSVVCHVMPGKMQSLELLDPWQDVRVSSSLTVRRSRVSRSLPHFKSVFVLLFHFVTALGAGAVAIGAHLTNSQLLFALADFGFMINCKEWAQSMWFEYVITKVSVPSHCSPPPLSTQCSIFSPLA